MKKIAIVLIALTIALANFWQSAEAKKLPSANDDISVQELIKMLSEKGVLTDAERVELDKRVKKKTKEDSLQVGGNIQLRYTQVQNDSNTSDQDTFGAKRARLYVKGNLFEDTEFFMLGMYEPANQGGDLNLLDAKISLKLSDKHKLNVGQYVVPFSLEDLASDMTIHTINRAWVVDKLAPNRDIGISLDGATENKVLKYSVGVFNGAGKNTHPDKGNDNDQYLYVGRMTVAPKTENVKVEIGANYARNNIEAGYARVDSTTFVGKEDLYGIDLSLGWNNNAFIGEYIKAKLNPETSAASINKDGFYLQYAYSFNPKYQAVLKHEEYDADTSVEANNDKKWTTIGLNQYIHGNDLRVSYNYIFKDESGASIKDNTFLTQLQVMF